MWNDSPYLLIAPTIRQKLTVKRNSSALSTVCIEELKGGKKVENIQVVDNSTLKFISAKDAWYVVGSSKPVQ